MRNPSDYQSSAGQVKGRNGFVEHSYLIQITPSRNSE